MQRTRIKFCGITRPADAIAAAEAGADAIGLVFSPLSSRHVSIDQAGEIMAALPPLVSTVGLFVNESVPEIIATVRTLNIRTVQLHGDESPDYVGRLHDLTVIKAIRCAPDQLAKIHEWRHAAGILIDTAHESKHGGSGVENNWELAKTFLDHREMLPPLIAAGGLTPGNVGSVIALLCPWAVDVSSGIEEAPGMKSIEKMRRFTDAVRKSNDVL